MTRLNDSDFPSGSPAPRVGSEIPDGNVTLLASGEVCLHFALVKRDGRAFGRLRRRGGHLVLRTLVVVGPRLGTRLSPLGTAICTE
jgi:hypothetical protein